MLLAKDLATKSDLSRGLKTIPFGLSKEEVGQMIEFATRNFLRTVQGGKFTDMFTINDSVESVHTQEPSRKFKELQCVKGASCQLHAVNCQLSAVL